MWLAKAFGWFLSMALIGVVLIVIVGFVAFQNRERIVNRALGGLAENYEVHLEEINFPETGRVEIKGLYLTPKDAPADARPTRVKKLEITYDFKEVRESRKVKTITMIEPTIRVDDRTLRAFGIGEQKAADEDQKAAVDLSFLGKFANSFLVKDGEFELSLESAPPVVFDWEFETSALDMASDEWMTQDPMRLRFSNIEIGLEAEFGTIDDIDVTLLLSPNFQRISVEEFGIFSPKVTFTPAWFPKSDSTNEQGTFDEPTLLDREKTNYGSLQIKRVFLREGEFAVQEFDGVPNISFGTGFDWSDFRWGEVMFYAGEMLDLKLADVVVGDGLAEVESIELRADWLDLFELNRVNSLILKNPNVLLSKETMKVFQKAESDEKSPKKEKSTETGKPFFVTQFEIWDADFVMSDLGEMMPEIHSGVNANFAGLEIGGEAGFTTTGLQRVWLDTFEMWSPGVAVDSEIGPIASFPAARAEFEWSDLIKQHQVDSLAIVQPVFEVTDASGGKWFESKTVENAEETVPDLESEVAEKKPIWRVGDLKISDGRVVVDTKIGGGKVPKVIGDFSIMTEPAVVNSDAESNPGYRAIFSDMRVRNHARAATTSKPVKVDEPPRLGGLFPNDPIQGEARPIRIAGVSEHDVVFVEQLMIDLTAVGLQRDQRIEKVKISGAAIKIGEGLKTMAGEEGAEESADALKGEDAGKPEAGKQNEEKIENPVAADNAATPALADSALNSPAPPEKGWEIGTLQVTQSQVQFESLVPQIEGLEFALETTIEDVLLTGEGLLKNEKLQKIELTGIEIMDPYDGFIRVAELPTVFVEFSLAGLMRQRIEKIDLLGPNLYVGQGLFWWIEYQKKYRAQNEGTSEGLEEKPGADLAIEAAADAEVPSWEIGTIAAHFGKIIIAPVGYPVGIVPFPFEAETNMEKGEIALKLEIPDEQYVYEFPNQKVQLFGLKGVIDFNIPLKQADNNLVQTFELDRAAWKQFEAENMYLTVTYDADGIYGKFGGNAYSGYAEGQFNIYLNETGKWDAWMAGTEMEMGPLTGIIAPEQFFMDGKVTAKIVSQGVGLEFGETTGDFQILEPGKFNVTKVDEILKELPDEWSMLQQSITKLGLETFKVFEYESGSGELYFLNRDGWLQMKLEGDTGKRELNVNVHDWRKKKVAAEGAE